MLARKKYRLLPGENVELIDGTSMLLHRIQALKDIPEQRVKKGDIGGYVSGTNSLSHKGVCWIADDAVVISNGLGHKEVAVNGATSISERAFVKDSKFNYFADADEVLSCPGVSGDSIIRNSVINGEIQISGSPVLSQVRVAGESSYYISGNAKMNYCVMQGKNSYIGDNAFVDGVTITDNVQILGDAQVRRAVLGSSPEAKTGLIIVKDNCSIAGMEIRAGGKSTITLKDKSQIHNNRDIVYKTIQSSYKHDITIGGTSVIASTDIRGSILVEGQVHIAESDIFGENVISGDVKIKEAVLRGVNRITGKTHLPDRLYIQEKIIESNKVINSDETSRDPVKEDLNGFQTKAVTTVQEELNIEVSAAITPFINAINETLADYDAYTLDIVKLLKYPAMTDGTIPEIRDLMVAVRKARRELKAPSSVEGLQATAHELETAFITAESKALTISTSHLDKKAQESLRDASQRLAIACNTGATDNERKLGFKAGMKSLDGILHVSEDAINAFKVKSGLLELEA